MNKRMFLKRANGKYTAAGSSAEISISDVQYAIDAYNKAKYGRLLYFDEETGDVLLTDEFPEFVK